MQSDDTPEEIPMTLLISGYKAGELWNYRFLHLKHAGAVIRRREDPENSWLDKKIFVIAIS
jgi:hypothetical protein